MAAGIQSGDVIVAIGKEKTITLSAYHSLLLCPSRLSGTPRPDSVLYSSETLPRQIPSRPHIQRDFQEQSSYRPAKPLPTTQVSDLKSVIELLSNGAHVPYLGITGVTVTEDIAEEQGIPVGVYVQEHFSNQKFHNR